MKRGGYKMMIVSDYLFVPWNKCGEAFDMAKAYTLEPASRVKKITLGTTQYAGNCVINVIRSVSIDKPLTYLAIENDVIVEKKYDEFELFTPKEIVTAVTKPIVFTAEENARFEKLAGELDD